MKKKQSEGSSEKTVQNQIDNSNNSKQAIVGAATERGVLGIVVVIAAMVLASSALMPTSLSGRLHPGLVPGIIAALALLAALASLIRPGLFTVSGELICQPALAAPWRSIFAAIATITILAFATRTLGLLPSVLLAGMVAALGVPGVGLARAVLTGAVLAAISALLFVGLLRQPLPLLPGVW